MTMTEKKNFLDSLSTEIADAADRLEKVKTRLAHRKAEARDRYEAKVRDLSEKLDRLRERVDAARASSGEAWGSLEDGLARSWSELKNGLADAAATFDGET